MIVMANDNMVMIDDMVNDDKVMVMNDDRGINYVYELDNDVMGNLTMVLLLMNLLLLELL